MHRIITDIGFKAFGPFLMPLLWGETCMVDILLKLISYKKRHRLPRTYTHTHPTPPPPPPQKKKIYPRLAQSQKTYQPLQLKQMKNKMKCPTGKLESDDH